MATLSLLAEITAQRDAVRDVLRRTAPETFGEQAHLDEESGARVYWSHGYQAALDDIIRLIVCREDCSLDRSTHSRGDDSGADGCHAVEKRGTARILA